LRLTKAPRTLVGEASEMYKGDAIEAIPTPRPTKTRPTMRIDGLVAAAMTAEPIKKSVSARRIAFLLPNRSLIHPPTAAPTIAPARAILTMASCIIKYSQTSFFLSIATEKRYQVVYNYTHSIQLIKLNSADKHHFLLGYFFVVLTKVI